MFLAYRTFVDVYHIGFRSILLNCATRTAGIDCGGTSDCAACGLGQSCSQDADCGINSKCSIYSVCTCEPNYFRCEFHIALMLAFTTLLSQQTL